MVGLPEPEYGLFGDFARVPHNSEEENRWDEAEASARCGYQGMLLNRPNLTRKPASSDSRTAHQSRLFWRLCLCTRSRRRLAKTNKCPANASDSITPLTNACRPSKLRRMSHGAVHRYTRTLAGRWITIARAAHLEEFAALPRRSGCAAGRLEREQARSSPSRPPASLRLFPPAQTPLTADYATVAANHKTHAPLGPVAYRTSGLKLRSSPAERSFLSMLSRRSLCVPLFMQLLCAACGDKASGVPVMLTIFRSTHWNLPVLQAR